MSKVVLHIGTHKTATTTIQDTFYQNSEKLAEAGLVYPRLAGPKITGHHGLVFAWGRLPEIYRLKEGSRKAFLQIAKEYGPQDNTVFLSSEEFSRGGTSANVDFVEVRKLLSGFDEIEVVCTLRAQWQYLQSVYQELSKNQIPTTPDKIVDPSIKNGIWKDLWIDYNFLLDQLLLAFDETEITFLDFDSLRQAEGGIIGAYLARYCPALTVEDLETVNGGASNVSPDPMASWMSNLVSPSGVAPKWLTETAEAVLDIDLGEKRKTCIFNKWEFQMLAEHFEERNEALRQRRLPFQPEFAITGTEGHKVTHFRNDLPHNAWVRMTRRPANRCWNMEKATKAGA